MRALEVACAVVGVVFVLNDHVMLGLVLLAVAIPVEWLKRVPRERPCGRTRGSRPAE